MYNLKTKGNILKLYNCLQYYVYVKSIFMKNKGIKS